MGSFSHFLVMFLLIISSSVVCQVEGMFFLTHYLIWYREIFFKSPLVKLNCHGSILRHIVKETWEMKKITVGNGNMFCLEWANLLVLATWVWIVMKAMALKICWIPIENAEFISLDCGGTSNYTDRSTGLPWSSDNGIMSHGKSVEVENPSENVVQYRRRREFPIDNRKYCYTLITQERRRYLVRATFQYGSLKDEETYPQFHVYLDATKWSTVSILDASRVYVKEMIIRAPSDSINVCICCATTGSPFISTLELRPLNLSMYATDFEDNFFLEVAARLNFGAPSKDPIR